MKKKNPLSIFRGREGHMYAALILLWKNYLQRQADFANENSKYTEELGTDQIDAVNEAQNLPDVSVRRSVPKEARDMIFVSATGCTNNWQKLSGLIESTYPQSQWDAKKALAGYASYKAAAGQQWDAVITLNNAAVSFIAENTDDLTAGGMLPGFPAQYGAAQKKFKKEYDILYETRRDASNQTNEKAAANNAICQTAIGMMNDAKKMYRNDPDLRAQFTYSSLMKMVRGTGFIKTGCRFLVLDVETGAPVRAATVLVTSGLNSLSDKTNEKGVIRFELSAGTYQFTITTPGFITIIGSVTVKDGTMHQKTIWLAKGVEAGFTTQIAAAAAI